VKTKGFTQLHYYIIEHLSFFVLFSDGILRQDVMMLNFFPQLNESEFSNNHEFIFIIDRSGVYYQPVL